MFASCHWMSCIYENPDSAAKMVKEYIRESKIANGVDVYTNGGKLTLPYIPSIHEILSKELQRDTSNSFNWNTPLSGGFLDKIGNSSYRED